MVAVDEQVMLFLDVVVVDEQLTLFLDVAMQDDKVILLLDALLVERLSQSKHLLWLS